MKKPNTSIVAIVRYATFALALAGTLSVFADRKWTAGGGNDTDWTNDANWDSGTGTRLFYQDNWNGKAIDNTINVSFTNRTTESGNAFFIQSKTDTVVFNAASDEAGLDITVPNSGNWWVQNFYVGTDAHNGAWVVNGGTYSIGGGSLYIGHNGNNKAATGEVTVNGATLNLYEDLLVGSGGTGTLTITNGGTVVCQSSSAGGKWVKLGDNGSSGANIINLEEGGTLMIWHIEQTSANSSSTVNFNGGTLTAIGKDSNNCRYLLGNTDSGHTVSPIVNILSKGGTIESVAGVDAVVTTPLVTGVSDGVDGGLIKAGAGGLTLAAAANTYTGPTVVEGGSLVLPEGGSLASTKLELAGGTFSGMTFDDITISAGDYSFPNLPVTTTGTVTLTGGILRMTVAEAQATADTARVVVNGGTILIDGSTAESVSVGSSFTFGNVTLGDNVEAANVVKVSGVNFDWTYGSSDGHPTATAGTASGENVWVGGAEGYWKDNINWTYGVPATGATARFDTDATVLFDANKTIASIVVNATVMFKSTDLASVHPTIYIHDVDGTGTIQLYHVGFEGNGGGKRIGSSSDNTLTLEFAVASTDSWLKYVSVYAPIIGSGYARFYDGTMLYGDNSAFTGTIKKDDGDTRFMAPEAGFPNASAVTIDGTIWLWFDEGEIEFGGRFTAYATGNCGFNLPGTVKNVTMTVGGGNGNVILSRGYDRAHSRWYNYYSAFVDSNGWQQGTDKFTLRKVGTGAITEYGVQSVYNFSLDGGSINLGAEKVYTGPDTRLTVANATLGIAAATTVASADFQSGSTLQSKYYETTEEETTTYGVNLLTVTGAATLNGLTLTAAGTTPNVDTTYTVLSAASVSGSAESGVADSDETDKKVWIAKVRQDSVMLMYGSKHPGFFVIIH